MILIKKQLKPINFSRLTEKYVIVFVIRSVKKRRFLYYLLSVKKNRPVNRIFPSVLMKIKKVVYFRNRNPHQTHEPKQLCRNSILFWKLSQHLKLSFQVSINNWKKITMRTTATHHKQLLPKTLLYESQMKLVALTSNSTLITDWFSKSALINNIIQQMFTVNTFLI